MPAVAELSHMVQNKNTFIHIEIRVPKVLRRNQTEPLDLVLSASDSSEDSQCPRSKSLPVLVEHKPRESFSSLSTVSSMHGDSSRSSLDLESLVCDVENKTSLENINRVISPSGRCDRLSKFITADAEKTTVMIRNIPCRCTQGELLDEITAEIPGVNFLYLPASRKRDGNMGYAFVNFTEPELAVRFVEMFQDRPFASHPKSMKRASVGYAMLQGYKENVTFYRRSKVSKSENRPYIKRC